eukprot:m.6231 g.6231  ORF g.6231 m.6231 type:complete len:463 (+) comp2563_c0_seq1:115-1503(+)
MTVRMTMMMMLDQQQLGSCRLLWLLVAVLVFVSTFVPVDCEAAWSSRVPEYMTEVASFPELASLPLRPSLPQGAPENCSIVDYGAVGNNKTEDTFAVQNAIDTCASVIFPAGGVYLIRPVFLSHSTITLYFETNATVVAWGDLDTWNKTSGGDDLLPLFFTDLSGETATEYVKVIGEEGSGGPAEMATIDGQGWRWWPYGKSRPRPVLMYITNAKNVELHNMRLKDSPSWNTHLRGDKFTITSNRVEANIESCGGYDAAPNTDGYNIGGTNFYLNKNFNHNGDDGIPVFAPSQNIFAENHVSYCGTNSGVVIGVGNYTLQDVLFRNISSYYLNQGVGMKISEPQNNVTGNIMNVTWDLIDVYEPRYAGVYINVFVEDANDCKLPSDPARTHWLTATDLTFSNVNIHSLGSNAMVGCFNCGTTRPCSKIRFHKVNLLQNPKKGHYTCHNVLFQNEGSNPPPCY